MPAWLGQHVVDGRRAGVDEQHHEDGNDRQDGLHEAAAQFDQVRDEGFLWLFLVLVQPVLLGLLGHGVVPVFGWSAGAGLPAAGCGSRSGAELGAGATVPTAAVPTAAAEAVGSPTTACLASRAVSFRPLRSELSVSRS